MSTKRFERQTARDYEEHVTIPSRFRFRFEPKGVGKTDMKCLISALYRTFYKTV